MIFTQSTADLFVPDSNPPDEALARTTHLGIGAHQDDLEFMALHGILECYEREDRWFGGITCTDGAGSARTGSFADYTDEQMKSVRMEEQRKAAVLGQYSFIAQLGHPSRHAKDSLKREKLVEDLVLLITESCPEFVYTHNPFDKHATHVGVMKAVLEAISRIPPEKRPKKVFGCEVWRGLDWLPDNLKVAQDVSAYPELATALNDCFQSQIGGGKRYDLAVEGRRLANATFLDSHSTDTALRVSFAVDLTELILEDGPSLGVFVDNALGAFNNIIRDGISG